MPKRYKVYRNLNNGKLSIRHPNGRVCGWADKVYLEDVTLIVQPAGREYVRKNKEKIVHAFVQGSILSTEGFQEQESGPKLEYAEWHDTLDLLGHLPSTKAYYNPYTTDFWVNKETGEELKDYWQYCYVDCKGNVLLK